MDNGQRLAFYINLRTLNQCSEDFLIIYSKMILATLKWWPVFIVSLIYLRTDVFINLYFSIGIYKQFVIILHKIMYTGCPETQRWAGIPPS